MYKLESVDILQCICLKDLPLYCQNMHLLYRNIPRINIYLEFHNHDKFGDESDIVSHEVSNMRLLIKHSYAGDI